MPGNFFRNFIHPYELKIFYDYLTYIVLSVFTENLIRTRPSVCLHSGHHDHAGVSRWDIAWIGFNPCPKRAIAARSFSSAP